jgi:hypothetical protein
MSEPVVDLLDCKEKLFVVSLAHQPLQPRIANTTIVLIVFQYRRRNPVYRLWH